MKKLGIIAMLLLLAATTAFAGGESENASDSPLVWVWYPNESTPEFAESRAEVIKVAEKALGREIKEQLTTDYAIAIEALVNENAVLSWWGGEGYVQGHSKEEAILPLVTNSGKSGTLSDAKYYSMLGTLKENDAEYKEDGIFSLDTLLQKRFSFVSNSSTSGFRVPSSIISKNFNVSSEELLEGGEGKVFKQVVFGGSHQGSLFNILTDKADIGAFCNSCVKDYVEWVQGSYDDPKAGDVIRIVDNADAPFNQVPGKEVTLVATVPVLNAPIVMNTNMLTADEIKALQDAFTSDEVANNPLIFVPKDSDVKGLFRQGQRFVLVNDEWYDPIRALAN